jgi:glucuronyl/N-acetylglucosaminyl transferase EXT2
MRIEHVLFVVVGALLFVSFVTIAAFPSVDIPNARTLLWKRDTPLFLDVLDTSDRKYALNTTCRFHNCFDALRCGLKEDGKLRIHIYPASWRIVDVNGAPLLGSLSKEFVRLLEAIENSEFHEEVADEACLLLPVIDTLNINRLDEELVNKILARMPLWNGGKNHLLFNFLPKMRSDSATPRQLESGEALIAGASFSRQSYRTRFDVSIPMYNVLTQIEHAREVVAHSYEKDRSILLAILHGSFSSSQDMQLQSIVDTNPSSSIRLDRCKEEKLQTNPHKVCSNGQAYDYPDLLLHSKFCVIMHGLRLVASSILDAMMMGCVPVIISDTVVLPFSDVLDWKRAALLISEESLGQTGMILQQIPRNTWKSMSKQALFLYNSYMSSMAQIALTTVRVIQDRVFPYKALQYEDWNSPPTSIASSDPDLIQPPPLLFIPLIPPQSSGFTALILTYDRLEILFKVINIISKTPSLSKIVVVWNNQDKSPPSEEEWPKVGKPLSVIRTAANKLSNRFYPYDSITTEAVLNLDDDMYMVTADELEFGFQVWREFPDRLVGFPGRVHVWDDEAKIWKYESEWMNEVSMVLTGAAFHHKFYSHAYTYMLPAAIRNWVDDHMNCEDIAMNFLISNYTHQGPIKVTPRKHFKCPNCNTSIWNNTDHFQRRNDCLNYFVEVFGYMPLKAVDFRADPVLFRDQYPENLKWFPAVGEV